MIGTEEQQSSLIFLSEMAKEQMMLGNDAEMKVYFSKLKKELAERSKLKPDEKFLANYVLAKYYRKIKNYDKAGNYSRKAIRLSKNIDKKQQKEMIDAYLDYAGLELEYGQSANARIELAKLLAVLEKENVQDAYTYGLIFSSLGKVSMKEENMEAGFTQLEKALNYFHQAVAATHPMVVQTIEALSAAYIQADNPHRALVLHQQLHAAFDKNNEYQRANQELLKLGEIYFYIDLKEARRTITAALKRMEEMFDGEHLDIAKANLMLAELDENMGNFPRAITYYKRALEQLNQFYEETHFMVVYAYSKIGTLSIKANEIKQAKQYLEQGLAHAGHFPKIKLQFLYALGKLYSGEKNYPQALLAFEAFLQMLKEQGQAKSKAYANTLQAIGFNYIEQNQPDAAFIYYQSALSIYEKIVNCKEEKGLTLIRLAYCYENMHKKNLEMAEIHYEKGFKLLEKVRNKGLLEEALAGIIEFYTRNDNPKKRRIYEDKFVKLQTVE